MAQISIMTTIMYTMWMNGCKFGRKAVEQIMEGGKSNRVIEAAFMLGTLVIYENPYCCCFLAKSLEQGMFS
ncbi:hypothetical protein [Propionispora vibrioides]|uniref:PTS system, mannose-specific IID component n=1 Tax=Propionispora vibrioides TaxID=112903 RepID=A0A1H8XAI1_9FIRM|nr:hypothetical protein [Propionispora vibrioides]SEP36930.1 PTS system, mannose-specific IID component [Propionispora vibrioides]